MPKANQPPKSIDGLMRYMRDKKGIAIKGSAQKQRLRNIGYYHGYKGYRFIGKASNTVPYTDFNQLSAVYDFDMRLKALLYPHLMSLETSLKNLVLEQIIKASGNDSFNNIYTNLLNDYKRFPAGSDKQKNAIRQRLGLRDRIYSTLTREYGNRQEIVQHFYHKDLNVPIWAIFEVITLGEFGAFFNCLNYSLRNAISKELGLHQPSDTDGFLTKKMIFAIKELRNAVAHNNVIFDTRFSRSNIDSSVSNSLVNETGIQNITFKNITDYIILVTYLLKCTNTSKSEMRRLISDFQSDLEYLRKKIPISIYTQIVPTNTRGKLKALRLFISQ